MDVDSERLPPEVYALLLVSGYFTDKEVVVLMVCEELDLISCDPYHKKYQHFDLDLYGCDECHHYFWFKKGHIPVLCELLQIQESYRSQSHIT